jgi:hypothetical protein
LSNLIVLLRRQLFVYRNPTAWFEVPFVPPPERHAAEYLPLALREIGGQARSASGWNLKALGNQ